ncbi:MAG: cobalt-precorrin-5B (C(1))-methyltransferase CbiD [Desulfobacterales bacterium]
MTAKKRKQNRLRVGFTTGTAAAAAAKAAAMMLFGGDGPGTVEIQMLNGDIWPIEIRECSCTADGAECTVVKDAGDDPDVTHGAIIGARVKHLPSAEGIIITGGEGVGRVTKPGLEVQPGKPAINPGPCRMIRAAVREAAAAAGESENLQVEVFVPDGEALARHTLNARLGIVGGISVLGTTGIVRPLSHEAYTATIQSAFSVARACGTKTVVCTTGRRSERYAQHLFSELPAEAFIQIGDYFAESMKQAGECGFAHVILAVFFGKALKMAEGVPHTHAGKSRLSFERLGDWMQAAGAQKALAEGILTMNTAREAFFKLKRLYPAVFIEVARRMVQSAEGFAGRRIHARAVIFDYSGGVAADTALKGGQ